MQSEKTVKSESRPESEKILGPMSTALHDSNEAMEKGYKRCLNLAMYMLARREHSRYELKKKIQAKSYSHEIDLDELIDSLVQKNYQSDQRFAAGYVRSRVQKGQGPLKIRFELKNRGIADELIEIIMEKSDVDWFEQARLQRVKKFGMSLPEDFKSRVRQSRFLSARGFDGEMVRYAVESD